MSNLITNLRDLVNSYQNYRSDTEISDMLGIDVKVIESLKKSLESEDPDLYESQLVCNK